MGSVGSVRRAIPSHAFTTNIGRTWWEMSARGKVVLTVFGVGLLDILEQVGILLPTYAPWLFLRIILSLQGILVPLT